MSALEVVATAALVLGCGQALLRSATLPIFLIGFFLEAIFGGNSMSRDFHKVFGIACFGPALLTFAGFLAVQSSAAGVLSPGLAWSALTLSTTAATAALFWERLEVKLAERRQRRLREMEERIAAEAEAARQERLAEPWTPGELKWRIVPTFWARGQVARPNTLCLTVETNHLLALNYFQDTRAGKKYSSKWELVDLATGERGVHYGFPVEEIAAALSSGGLDPFAGLLEARALEAALEEPLQATDRYYAPKKQGWKTRAEELRKLEPPMLTLCREASTASEGEVKAAQARAELLRSPSSLQWDSALELKPYPTLTPAGTVEIAAARSSVPAF